MSPLGSCLPLQPGGTRFSCPRPFRRLPAALLFSAWDAPCSRPPIPCLVNARSFCTLHLYLSSSSKPVCAVFSYRPACFFHLSAHTSRRLLKIVPPWVMPACEACGAGALSGGPFVSPMPDTVLVHSSLHFWVNEKMPSCHIDFSRMETKLLKLCES